MSSLADEIIEVLCTIAPDVDRNRVDHVQPLADQLDLDSMDYQNLLAALSTRYAVTIKEVDVPKLRSLDDIVAYVTARRTGIG